jgi:hypothetical protein
MRMSLGTSQWMRRRTTMRTGKGRMRTRTKSRRRRTSITQSHCTLFPPTRF